MVLQVPGGAPQAVLTPASATSVPQAELWGPVPGAQRAEIRGLWEAPLRPPGRAEGLTSQKATWWPLLSWPPGLAQNGALTSGDAAFPLASPPDFLSDDPRAPATASMLGGASCCSR